MLEEIFMMLITMGIFALMLIGGMVAMTIIQFIGVKVFKINVAVRLARLLDLI